MLSLVDLPENIHLHIYEYRDPRHLNNLPELISDAAKRQLLRESARGGSLAAIQKLVDEFKFEVSNHAGYEALKLAAQKGHVSVVAYLLDRGVEYCRESEYRALMEVPWSDRHEQSALELAAVSGNFNVVRLLLNHGATPEDKVDALILVVRNEEEMVVRELLDRRDPGFPGLLSATSSVSLL
ncbi:ankyrin repeat domain-containing protein [Aspergillus lucknowensis]|uniref:Ankyrin repeat-containing domain protein n=1 Tax=Aspergillus lucknowensis TaxID=176173 RepID=A0ABR4LPT1_9EURO